MSRVLWPRKADDGSVRVAVRLSATPDQREALEGLLAEWVKQISVRAPLSDSLQRSPYMVPRSNDEVDIVFESRPGNRLWRDWLVSLSADIDEKKPDIRRRGFWDLISGEPNPASIRTS